MADQQASIATLENRLKRLEDEAQIRALISRYGRAIDRGERASLAAIFSSDAKVDYGKDVFVGDGSTFVPAVLDIQAQMVRTQHLIGQTVLNQSLSTAKAETYSQAIHIVERNGDYFEFATGSRYLDKLAKIEGKWRIVERKVVIDWMRELSANEDLLSRLACPPTGGRGVEDQSYNFLSD